MGNAKEGHNKTGRAKVVAKKYVLLLKSHPHGKHLCVLG